MNTEITSSDIVVLTGAGSTASLGFPTMKQFLQRLREYAVTNADIAKGIEYINEWIPESRDDLEYLIDGLNLSREFEDFYGSVYAAAWDYESELDDKLIEIRKLREYVYTSIVDTYSESSNLDAVSAHFKPLWSILTQFNSSSVVPFFTTNYDWSIEMFADADERIELVDGFTTSHNNSVWRSNNYDRATPDARRRIKQLVLFKMHGSTDWYLDSAGRIKRIGIASRSLPNMTNRLIYPGRTKVESLDEPYQTNYRYFAACLRNAKVLLVIGFSFLDLSIQRIIESALEENDQLRLVIINGPGFESSSISQKPDMIDGRSRIISEYFDGNNSGYSNDLRMELGTRGALTLVPDPIRSDGIYNHEYSFPYVLSAAKFTNYKEFEIHIHAGELNYSSSKDAVEDEHLSIDEIAIGQTQKQQRARGFDQNDVIIDFSMQHPIPHGAIVELFPDDDDPISIEYNPTD